EGFGRLFGSGRRLGKLCEEIGKIQGVVFINLDAAIGLDGPDVFEDPGFAEKGGQLEIGVGLFEGKKWLPVLVLDEQPANGPGEHEGIDPHLADGGLAVELFGKLFYGDGFDNQRQNEEAEDGIKQEQAGRPNELLASARGQRVPETE